MCACRQHCPEPVLSRVIQPKDAINLLLCMAFSYSETKPKNFTSLFSVLHPETNKAYVSGGGKRAGKIWTVFSLFPSTQAQLSEVIISLIIPNYFI